MQHSIRTALVLGLASVGAAQVPAAHEARALPHPSQLGTYASQLGAVSFPGGGASGGDAISCAAHTASGAVVVAGNTSGSLGEANAGRTDIFVARFGRSGDLQWVTQVGALTAPSIPALNGQPGGPGGDASLWESVGDIVIGDDGTILITGQTYTSLGETNAGTSPDLFVARLTGRGALLWLRQIGVETAAGIVPAAGATSWGDSSGGDGGRAIALDPGGGFWVAGSTNSDLSERNHAEQGVLLAHFDDDGHLDRLQQIGEVNELVLGFGWSDDTHNPTDLLLTPSGPVVSITTDVFSGGDLFFGGSLLSFDPAGVPLGLTSAPSSVSTVAAMTACPAGRIYVTGSTQEVVYDLQYQFDAVVACYDPIMSRWCWATRLDDALGASLGLTDLASDEWPGGLALDGSGTLVVAGHTQGSLDELNAGGSDLFVMKLRAMDGALESVHQLGQDTAAATGRDLAGSETARDMYVTPLGLIGILGSTTGSPGEPTGGAADALAVRLRPNGFLD